MEAQSLKGKSLSHDIIKAHGGELRIGTNGSGGATFTIMLPTGESL